MRGFLDAFGVPVHRIPTDLDAQAALWRSLLSGRRALIVPDNARDTEQVRPLLPGAPGCLAMVTSRNQLIGLVAAEAAHPITLGVLTAAEAHRLPAHRLGADRVAAEPQAIEEIVVRCASAPCAGDRSRPRRDASRLPARALAAELSETHAALDAFAIGEAATDMRAVFPWSYEALSAPAARLFRLLSSHPGPDAAVPAIAGIAGLPVARVRPLLAEPARAHLLAEHTVGRYSFHDLLRTYAAELAEAHDPETDRRAALRRMQATTPGRPRRSTTSAGCMPGSATTIGLWPTAGRRSPSTRRPGAGPARPRPAQPRLRTPGARPTPRGHRLLSAHRRPVPGDRRPLQRGRNADPPRRHPSRHRRWRGRSRLVAACADHPPGTRPPRRRTGSHEAAPRPSGRAPGMRSRLDDR